jgi:UDP-N-acetyl-D-mannosaminuronic acid transferase (WecB/TagA/CpsF family)
MQAAADSRLRFATQRQALPPWADRDHMKWLYRVAAAYRQAGESVHVDHIVPLRSKRVSGLHVLANLRLMFAEENLKKSNLWWPDMP